MSKDNGGPAFPIPLGPGQSWSSEHYADCDGMTLRDYFAAKAMPVLLEEITDYPDEHWRVGVALDAYRMADAMIAARAEE